MPQRFESGCENDDCLFGEGPSQIDGYGEVSIHQHMSNGQGTLSIMRDTCGAGSHTHYQMEGHPIGDQMQARGSVDPRVEGAGEACPPAAVGGARQGNDQVVRNKILKENTNKNVNQKRTNNSIGKDERVNGKVRSNLQMFSKNPNFEPKLQVKRYDSDREPGNTHRKMSNATKEKKQAMNRSSALSFGNGEHFESERDSIEEEVYERLRNGYHPDSDQTSTVMPHRRETSNEIETEYSSVHGLVETVDDSDEDYTNQTDPKSVNFTHIHNDLWGKNGNETKGSATNVPLNMSNLNKGTCNLNVIQNDLETDNDANQTVLKLNTDAVYKPASGMTQQHSPIVVSYDKSLQGDSPSLDLVTSENNPFTIPLSSVSHSGPITSNDSLGNLDSLSSNLPTSLFFGEGNDDLLYAQQLHRRYERENQEQQAQGGYDIVPESMYLQFPSRLQSSDNARSDIAIRAEAFPNDTYDVSEAESNDHIVVPYGVQRQESRARGGAEPEPSNLPNPPIFISHGVLTEELYPDPHTQETERTLILPRGSGGVTTEMDDEMYARMLQEELNRDVQQQDEDFARMLQEHEEDRTHLPAPPCTVHNHRGLRTPGASPDHQPLRTRYGHTWLNRPLTVGPSAGNNVADSRIHGRNTWQRPLQRQQPGAGAPYDEFAYLDNIHSLPDEGYDIPPQTADYYLRYEYDPDMEYGDEHLISINRDPHQLAALLMDRAPDMMIPNDVDLNDYEALWELAEGLGEVRRVGMEVEEISILPVHTYQGNQGDNKTDCLVCLSEFTPGERLRTLPCCHIYHVDCIDEWLKRNAICPVCRQPAVQRE